MSHLHNTAAQFVMAGAEKTLHTGPGKLHSLIATTKSATPVEVTMSEPSEAGVIILLRIAVSSAAPVIIFWPPAMPLRFQAGLTVKAGADTYVMVEA